MSARRRRAGSALIAVAIMMLAALVGLGLRAILPPDDRPRCQANSTQEIRVYL